MIKTNRDAMYPIAPVNRPEGRYVPRKIQVTEKAGWVAEMRSHRKVIFLNVRNDLPVRRVEGVSGATKGSSESDSDGRLSRLKE